MAISFRNIPANLRVPLAYFEFDPTMAGSATAIQNALILCTVPTTAALPLGVPTLIISADHARSLAGVGSALGRQCQRWFQNNRSVPLYALAAAQTGFTASTGSITWGGPATESGVIPLYIGGRLCRIIVAAGDDDAAISAAAMAAINADPTLGVTAAIDGTDPEQTNITAAQLGLLGRLKIEFAIGGAIGGEMLPAGVTQTTTPMTPGAGSPDIAALLSTIGDAPFDFVICPWPTLPTSATAAADLGALDEFFNDTTGRWSWQSQLYGHGFCCVEGTVGTLSALGETRNGQHVSVFGFNNSPTPTDEWLAAYVGEAAGSLIIDPARPVQALPLEGVHAPPRGDRFTIMERQVLYFDGIASYYVTEDGTPMIDRLITTYRRNVWGAPDDSMLDIETLYTGADYARSAKNRILLKFPRSKLANDGTRFGVGQAIVTPSIIRAEMIAHYGELEDLGRVENADGFEDALIVERSATDPNRVDVLLPPDFVNQLRIFAALVQFRL
jgi:phage tail sheath gpL-like